MALSSRSARSSRWRTSPPRCNGQPACSRGMPGHDASGGAAAARGAIDAVWRIESARLIAGLARYVGDVGMGEDLAHDALDGRARAMAGVGSSRQPRGLAHGGGKAPRHRHAAAPNRARAQAGRARTRARGPIGSVGSGHRRAGRVARRLRRRSPASDLRGLPPGPVHRSARGIDPATARGSHHRRDRPRLSRP